MKNKVICILIGMGIMGVLVGCGQAIKGANAGENGYLNYCGRQENVFGNKYKQIEVYEDDEHGNVVYALDYNGSNTLSISVVPKHEK